MSDPSTWSLTEAAKRIARRDLSARELTRDRLAAAEAAQGRLNAFIGGITGRSCGRACRRPW